MGKYFTPHVNFAYEQRRGKIITGSFFPRIGEGGVMEDIKTILVQHIPRKPTTPAGSSREPHVKIASTSEIPDLFFDEIL